MTRFALTASAVVFALPVLHAGDDARKEAVRKELKRLEGTWSCRWLGRNGQKFEADGGLLTIKGGRWYANEKAIASFTIDPTTTPKLIDVTDLLEKDGLMAEGIYKLEGDRLVICLNARGGVRERPLEFATAPGSEKFLFWYERMPPRK